MLTYVVLSIAQLFWFDKIEPISEIYLRRLTESP